jgi:hypothetical protein
MELNPHQELVRRRLSTGVLTYLRLAPRLKKQWLYRTHWLYSWTRDILAIAVGTGLLPPIFSHVPEILENDPHPGLINAGATRTLPLWVFVMGVVSLVALGALKLIVFRQEAAKKTVLMDDCCKEFTSIRHDLDKVLDSNNPLPDLAGCQNRIAATVGRLINAECWPFEPPYRNIQAEVELLTEYYCSRYATAWTSVAERE